LPPHRRALKKSLRAIERAFADIAALADALSDRVRVAERGIGRTVKTTATSRRQLRITPQRRAQLKLQGVYMTYVRQLGPRQKARVKAVKAKRGFEAAIRVAKRLVERSA
jgi:hypothetical protein